MLSADLDFMLCKGAVAGCSGPETKTVEHTSRQFLIVGKKVVQSFDVPVCPLDALPQ